MHLIYYSLRAAIVEAFKAAHIGLPDPDVRIFVPRQRARWKMARGIARRRGRPAPTKRFMNRRATRTPNTQQQLRDAKPGDILLFYRANGLSRLITWFSSSRFYHVGIYAGDTFVVEARITGVVRSDLRVRSSGRYFRVIPAPQDQGEAALRWAAEQIGDSYASLSVLALICDRLFDKLQINITQRNQFSCGELVVKAFAEAGVCLFCHRAAELTSPWDFAHLLSRRNDCDRKSR